MSSCVGTFYTTSASGSKTLSCTNTLNVVGKWSFTGTICARGVSGYCHDITHNLDVKNPPCKTAGQSCSANSDCCAYGGQKMCRSDGQCISGCPSGFKWDLNDPGTCVPIQAVCYDSSGSITPTCSYVPEWGNTCGGTTMSQACCPWKSYNGVSYGIQQLITSY